MALRLFVTGGTGTIGRHLVRMLHQDPRVSKLSCSKADVTNSKAIHEEVQSAGEIDIVIHLAALVPVKAVNLNPASAYSINVGGTANLLCALASNKCRFIYCSSAHVYAPSSDPISEEDKPLPGTLYGQTKLMGERIAQDVCSSKGWPLCIARVFSIHDPNQAGSFLRPSLERRLASHPNGEQFEITEGDSIRDFLTAEDAAHLLLKLALNDFQGIVNVASGKPQTVSDFAKSLSSSPLNVRSTGQAQHLYANIDRLYTALGD